MQKSSIVEETMKAIEKLKNNKATSRDRMPADCRKEGGCQLIKTRRQPKNADLEKRGTSPYQMNGENE